MSDFSHLPLVLAEGLGGLSGVVNGEAGLAAHIVGVFDCLEGLATHTQVQLLLRVHLYWYFSTLLLQ